MVGGSSGWGVEWLGGRVVGGSSGVGWCGVVVDLMELETPPPRRWGARIISHDEEITAPWVWLLLEARGELRVRLLEVGVQLRQDGPVHALLGCLAQRVQEHILEREKKGECGEIWGKRAVRSGRYGL